MSAVKIAFPSPEELYIQVRGCCGYIHITNLMLSLSTLSCVAFTIRNALALGLSVQGADLQGADLCKV